MQKENGRKYTNERKDKEKLSISKGDQVVLFSKAPLPPTTMPGIEQVLSIRWMTERMKIKKQTQNGFEKRKIFICFQLCINSSQKSHS